MISQRELTCRRKRRQRREARESAYREHVCGGPLLDHRETILSGGDSAEHAAYVQEELQRRSARMAFEIAALATDFVIRLYVYGHITKGERSRLIAQTYDWHRRWGGPTSVPTHSTAPHARTITGTTIPRL